MNAVTVPAGHTLQLLIAHRLNGGDGLEQFGLVLGQIQDLFKRPALGDQLALQFRQPLFRRDDSLAVVVATQRSASVDAADARVAQVARVRLDPENGPVDGVITVRDVTEDDGHVLHVLVHFAQSVFKEGNLPALGAVRWAFEVRVENVDAAE